ncbi:MAG TPA: hypothetical protein VGL03_11850 [Thermoanaerobaculia bacterium]|jgi:hypothetical protein
MLHVVAYITPQALLKRFRETLTVEDGIRPRVEVVCGHFEHGGVVVRFEAEAIDDT